MTISYHNDHKKHETSKYRDPSFLLDNSKILPNLMEKNTCFTEIPWECGEFFCQNMWGGQKGHLHSSTFVLYFLQQKSIM